MLLHINGKFTMGKLKSFLLCRKVSLLIRGVGQGMRQTQWHLWYPLPGCDTSRSGTLYLNGIPVDLVPFT